MARKDKPATPYRACQSADYVLRENTFRMDESRLKNSFGAVYDKALNSNHVPSTSWRDLFSGAALSTFLTMLFTGFDRGSFSWDTLSFYIICSIVLLLVSAVLWGKYFISVHNAQSGLTLRQQVIDEAFNEIVSISECDSE